MNRKYIMTLGVGIISLIAVSVYWLIKKETVKTEIIKATTELISAEDLIDKTKKKIKGEFIYEADKAKIDSLYKGVKANSIPHVFVEKIPEKFDIFSEDDKTLFMKIMTPHLLLSNEKIMNERRVLFVLNEKMKLNQPFSEKEKAYFEAISQKYDVLHLKADTARMAELLLRVDIIPVSLGVAVSIWATAWGQENKESPFMEYAWNDKVKYELVQFKKLSEASDSFALQLNTRSQLVAFRADRQRYRFFDKTLSFGWGEVLNMHHYLQSIPTFMDQLKLIYSLGYIKELDAACFKEGCALTK